MPGAWSGVTPAHGASSSQDRRSPTMPSVAALTRRITSAANRVRSAPQSSVRLFVSPDKNCRTRLCWPALISTPSQPDDAASAAASANPEMTASMSSASICFGTSRVLTSGTGDGAHSSRWL